MTAQLFKSKPIMLIELDRLEKLFPKSEAQLQLLSKTIRREIWGISNESILAAYLYACNRVFGIIGDISNEESYLMTQYIEFLKQKAPNYCGRTLDDIYDTLLLKIHEMFIKEIIDSQWRRINPHHAGDFAPDEFANGKNIISILNEFYEIIATVPSEEFLKPLYIFEEDYTLARGRPNKWVKKHELAAPSKEIAKRDNIINRWNPPGKRYLYLAVGDARSTEETVIAEMRAKEGEEVTVGQFKIMDYAKNRIIVNLDFELISRTEIFSSLQASKKQAVNEIVNGFIASGRTPTGKAVRKKIESKRVDTEKAVKVFTGQFLLKEIGDVIFVPLDTDEDSDAKKKDRCYKSFHVLAEYFEDKGYAGIAFPSTRMKLKGKSGKNLVLFDADSAEAREETMKTLIVGHEE